ncbi:Anp1-domain-containing protein [Gongronella butleri]|nr:Anp1-domain-containing protein [Gongronella butleri]
MGATAKYPRRWLCGCAFIFFLWVFVLQCIPRYVAPPVLSPSVIDTYAATTASSERGGASPLSSTLPATAAGPAHVLIVTPLKNAAPYLTRYFDLIDRMDYPKSKISIAFLVSDTTDRTVAILQRQQRRWQYRYHSFDIFEKDYHFQLPEARRHDFHMQPLRRSYMARSRNHLLSLALKPEHQWVLWLDVDVVRYPTSILRDLMSVNVDVIVPNCLRVTDDGSFWGYDKNNWQETEESLVIQRDLDPEYVLLEGYNEFLTERYLLVDMPTHLGKMKKVPLDGVGATFTLVKAEVHREGANFPAFVFQHQVETEGFAKMARAMGYGVYGLPGYLVYHAKND